jgi:inosine-uridine nucleoside N-ribohydrolase
MEMPLGEKLVIIVSGPATNVATAIRAEPKIIERIVVYFIGTFYNFDSKAFNKNEPNARSDLYAMDRNIELAINSKI